jgi:hypothetical protein
MQKLVRKWSDDKHTLINYVNEVSQSTFLSVLTLVSDENQK